MNNIVVGNIVHKGSYCLDSIFSVLEHPVYIIVLIKRFTSLMSLLVRFLTE